MSLVIANMSRDMYAYQEKVDLCIVVGDKMSSNSKKLAKVSNEIAKIKTIFCEDLKSLDKNELIGINSVSITSGASTPEYITKEINKVDVKEILKEVLSKEDVKEKYVRDFLNCSMIDKNSDIVQMDKIMFIYKYGSKKAKKIAVDERLKMI